MAPRADRTPLGLLALGILLASPPVFAREVEAPLPAENEPPPPAPEPRSEGRQLVSLYNSGFQWSVAPGVVFAGGEAGFFLGLRIGYGFDFDTVIVVPEVMANGYFLDANVYLGMPVLKVVIPIDRFAPFVEGGLGVGHVTEPSKTAAAWMTGAGFMIHVSSRFALGAEARYQAVTSTSFGGWSVGPILALGF